jgi:hypothetical protein
MLTNSTNKDHSNANTANHNAGEQSAPEGQSNGLVPGIGNNAQAVFSQ